MAAMVSFAKRSNGQQSRVAVAVLLGASLLFGLFVLPRLDPGRSVLLGAQASDFALPVIYGGEPGGRIRLSELRGHVVLLDFWASWCRPCLEQMTILDRAAREPHFRTAMVIGVNSDEQPEQALALLGRLKPSYPTVADEGGAVARAFGVDGLPTLVVIGADGVVRAIETGVMSGEQIAALLDSAR
ncbi:MAG: TlpA family protein disulfide reductase [Polyangiaceae bacterium]|nr:TlpA family protein disulfide reductase [Polyangiaceae bacterium]